MGGVAQAVGNFVSGAVESVGNIASSAVREIGHAAESVGREIGKIGEAAAQNPIGTIAKVGAVASGQWWALPAVSALDVVAHGGNLEQAALSAGVSLAASWAGGQIASNIMAPAADSTAAMATADAANMVAQNIPADQISQVLQQSYGITGNIADSIANATAAGVAPQTLASAYAGAFGQQLTGAADAFSEKLIANSLGNSAANFAKTLVQTGGDVAKALSAGAGAGIGTGFGGIVSNELAQAGANSTLAQITGKIAGSTTSGVVQGQDLQKALGTSLVNNIVSTSYSQAGALFKSALEQSGITKIFSDIGTKGAIELNKTAEAHQASVDKATDLEKQTNAEASKYNELLNQSQSYYKDNVEPAQQEAMRLQETATSSYDAYKSKADEYSSLVKQYDDLKAQYDAAPDVATKNTFADKLNALVDKSDALIPQLNAATEKYNADANAYQASYDNFQNVASTYKDYTTNLETINTKYTELNSQLAQVTEVAKQQESQFVDQSKAVEQQVQQVIEQKASADKQMEGQPEAVKQAYLNAFSTGKMPDEALQVGEQVSKLSGVSQEAFNKSFDENGDIDSSLQLAANVNSMDKSQQNYFDFATNAGLKASEAVGVVPTLSGMSVASQQAFFDQFENDDVEAVQALDFANKVQSLDDKQQLAFYNALMTGVDSKQALEIAPVISGFNQAEQAAYANAIKSGAGQGEADLISAFAALGGDNTAAVDKNAANLAKLTTDDQKQAYMQLVSGAGNIQVSPEKAMAFVTQGIDPISGKKIAEDIISALTGSGEAQAGSLPTTPTTPKNVVDAVYRTDPASGKMVEMIPDGKGGYVPTGAVTSFGAGMPAENTPSGSKYAVDEKIGENGVPSMSMTPYTGATTSTDSTASGSSPDYSKPVLDAALAAGEISKAEYDDLLSKATDTAVTTAPITPGGMTNTSTWQDYINDLLTKTPAAGTGTGTATGATGTSAGTTAGSGTGTTGTATAGGVATGTGTGTSAPGTGTTGTGVPGTGTGGGGTGTGTGGGGTGGTGAGGTGTGTGGGGTGTAGGGGTGGGYQNWSQNFGQAAQSQYGGITNLTPGLTKANQDYTLAGQPMINEDMTQIPQFATGGYTGITDLNDPSNKSSSGLSAALTPALTKAQLNYILTGLQGLQDRAPVSHAEGGAIEGHNPTFFSEGGLGAIENRYAKGEGDGTSDEIPAMLAHSEFVIPADVVSSLGNGSSDAGAKILDEFLRTIREHKRSADAKELPPDSKGPLGYLLEAKKKVKS